MTELQTIRAELETFSKTFSYDASYMTQLAEHSLGAYQAFAVAQQLGYFRKALPAEAHAIAGIATTLSDDCGACAQLGLRMAVAQGIDRALLQQLLDDPTKLPGALADVAAHARSVVAGEPDDHERAARLRAAYGDEGLAELAVRIAGTRLYPTLKRALFRNDVCTKPSLDF